MEELITLPFKVINTTEAVDTVNSTYTSPREEVITIIEPIKLMEGAIIRTNVIPLSLGELKHCLVIIITNKLAHF